MPIQQLILRTQIMIYSSNYCHPVTVHYKCSFFAEILQPSLSCYWSFGMRTVYSLTFQNLLEAWQWSVLHKQLNK